MALPSLWPYPVFPPRVSRRMWGKAFVRHQRATWPSYVLKWGMRWSEKWHLFQNFTFIFIHRWISFFRNNSWNSKVCYHRWSYQIDTIIAPLRGDALGDMLPLALQKQPYWLRLEYINWKNSVSLLSEISLAAVIVLGKSLLKVMSQISETSIARCSWTAHPSHCFSSFSHFTHQSWDPDWQQCSITAKQTSQLLCLNSRWNRCERTPAVREIYCLWC